MHDPKLYDASQAFVAQVAYYKSHREIEEYVRLYAQMRGQLVERLHIVVQYLSCGVFTLRIVSLVQVASRLRCIEAFELMDETCIPQVASVFKTLS